MFQYIRKKWPKIKKEYKYNIPVDSEKIIKYVEFSYFDNKKGKKNKKTVIWLLVDGEPTDFINLHSSIICRWELNKKVTELKLVSTKKLEPKYMEIDIVYEEETWISLAPEESYPLPTEPPEISRITFEAKTDPGTTSIIMLFKTGLPFKQQIVTETPTTIEFIFSSSPTSSLALTNTGSNTVYIRNLTTE